MKQLGFTRKKRVRASEHDRPDIAVARAQWAAEAPTLDPTRLVFLDESGVATNLLRRYGRWSTLGFSWTLDCERVLARGVSR